MLSQTNLIVRPQFVQVLMGMEALAFRPRIQCAYRSPEEQETAYESGHSSVRWGYHCCETPDGHPDALAIDVLDDDSPLAPRREYLMALTTTARANGLNTGLLWGLPDNIRAAIEAALARGEVYEGHIGFDPTHVEAVGVSIADARAGERPAPFVTPPTQAENV